jgi:hypothetical protein
MVAVTLMLLVALPGDPRLQPAQAQLQATIDAAEKSGLPAELLIDKVREGLAKGVPAVRIAQVVAGLSTALANARSEATPYVAHPPAALLKAIADAHALSVSAVEVQTVLRASTAKGASTRAIEVLSDLVQRGFPSAPSARAVAEVASHRPGALAQLAPHAESLAASGGVGRSEALDALARAAAQGLGLDHAGDLVGKPGNDTRGPNREATGARGPGGLPGATSGHGKGHD